MRAVALGLVVAAVAVAGCGSDNGSSGSAPTPENVSSSGSTGASAAGVSAKGRPTPASLCAAEGSGKPRKQCVAGLGKLDRGSAANPSAACKGLSKKKTKGVRGKSPYAVCVSAAAKLMASKSAHTGKGKGKGNGAADSSDDQADDSSDSTADSSSADDGADPICHDAKGKVVSIDSDDVEECDVPDASGDTSDDGE